jgi:hypothetical protein
MLSMSRTQAARHQLGPGGPTLLAWRWLRLILDEGNLRQAWALTAPDLRKTLADAWVRANLGHPALRRRDANELIPSLAAVSSSDPLWPGFEETQVREFQDVWSYVDLDTYAPASDPRPSGPDQEGVVFVDTTHPGLVEQPDGALKVDSEDEYVPMPGRTLLMRYFPEPPDPGVTLTIEGIENGWRVADLKYEEPVEEPT